MSKIRVIELFAGIGGFRYGLERVQLKNANVHPSAAAIRDKIRQLKQFDHGRPERLFDCVWSNEQDKYACQIYRRHYDFQELCAGDIRQISPGTIPDCDLLTAGFPCQSFSIAGKRGGFNDTRGTLFFEIARICRAKRPRLILLENVKGLLSHESGRTFQTILKVLSDIGYVLQWEVLNSKNYSVPQNRERVFIVGHLRGTSRPEVFPIRKSETISETTHSRQQGKRPRLSSTIDSRYGALRNSGETYLIHNVYGGFKEKAPRVFTHVSPTIRTPKGGGHLPMVANTYNASIRRLTPIECERLQGFPDDWTKFGINTNGKKVPISDTQRYKTLGNAVTTSVITAIGERLIK